jgi:hypothetical protein
MPLQLHFTQHALTQQKVCASGSGSFLKRDNFTERSVFSQRPWRGRDDRKQTLNAPNTEMKAPRGNTKLRHTPWMQATILIDCRMLRLTLLYYPCLWRHICGNIRLTGSKVWTWRRLVPPKYWYPHTRQNCHIPEERKSLQQRPQTCSIIWTFKAAFTGINFNTIWHLLLGTVLHIALLNKL